MPSWGAEPRSVALTHLVASTNAWAAVVEIPCPPAHTPATSVSHS